MQGIQNGIEAPTDVDNYAFNIDFDYVCKKPNNNEV
jgi:hypothetical protein